MTFWPTACIIAAAVLCCGCASQRAEVMTLKRNGGWCWFQDPRAFIDGDRIVVASVAGATIPGSGAGDIDVTSFNLNTRRSTTFTLAPQFQCDDHDVPAILKLPDGRYLAVYQKHGSDSFMRWRISTRPGDITDWLAERTADVGAGNTYANLFRLSAENARRGRIYNFHRGIGFNPNYMLSDDNGQTFRYGGRLMSWRHPQGIHGGGRPYLRYASDNTSTIHFIATEDHPHRYDNSIYHGFYRAGSLHQSDGTRVAPLASTDETTIGPTTFTRVFAGGRDRVAWANDIQLDAHGRPAIVFSVSRDNPSGMDIRYWYGRWDGSRWHVSEIAHAGTRLYEQEYNYAGLAAIDPGDANVVVISTNANPASGKRLPHWEIFRGVTRDGGETWKWTPLTCNSTQDNIRPIVLRSPGKRAILWLRGTYRTYRDYNLDVVATIEPTR